MRSRPSKNAATTATRERRVHVRVPIRAAVTVANGPNRVCGWVRNLSAGGMFVETDEPFARETEVQVDTLMRDGSRVHHFRTLAWVAWVSPDGMGLQFDDLSPDDYHFILSTVDRLP